MKEKILKSFGKISLLLQFSLLIMMFIDGYDSPQSTNWGYFFCFDIYDFETAIRGFPLILFIITGLCELVLLCKQLLSTISKRQYVNAAIFAVIQTLVFLVSGNTAKSIGYVENFGVMYTCMLTTLLVLDLIVVVLAIVCYNKMAYERKIKNKKLFIETCKKNGIKTVNDLSTTFAKKKCVSIAVQCGLIMEGVDVSAVELYEKTRQELEEYQDYIDGITKEKEKRASFSALRRDELEKLRSLTKYSNYIGVDKRVAILTEEYNELYNKYKQLSSGAKGADNFGIQKERDWSIAGGIASGLAGGAAGLATALDVQAQNQQIRESNARQREFNATYLAPIKNQMLLEAGSYLKEANKVYEKIEEAKLKVVSDAQKEEIFKNLKITDKDVYVSSTGAIEVSAKITVEDRNMNYIDGCDNWVIDGTFIAKIYDGDKKIGVAELVIPFSGITKSITLEGICIANDPDNENYTFEIVPKHIWVMEK